MVLASVACTSGQKNVGESATAKAAVAEIRETARFDQKTGYRLPTFQEKRLENGLTVLLIPDDRLPYVSLSLLVRAGSAHDPVGLSGLSQMVAELVDKGTKKRSAEQIASDLEQMGAQFDVTSSLEYTMASASALSIHGDALLKNMIEVLTQPTFSDTEIERTRKQALAAIAQNVDRPESFSELAFESFLYGAHPYARPLMGTPKDVGAIKKKHIIQHYLRYYRPNNSILAVIGKFDSALEGQIMKAFGEWPGREVARADYPAIAPIQGMQIQVVDNPGLVQSQIRLGHLGIKRQTPDFIPLRVANTILGGAFASRLNDRVRKDLGLTYSISSSFDARQDRGPFEISTFTKNQSVGQTVTETLKILEVFRDQGVSRDEVDMAKGYLKGVFPNAIETPEKLALNLMLLRFYGVPDSYLTTYLSEIDRVSVSEINSVIKKYIDDRNMKVVVYSNAAEVVPQLEPIAKSHGGAVFVKKAAEIQ